MFANNLNNTFAFQFKILTDKAFSFLYFTSSFLWNIDRKKNDIEKIVLNRMQEKIVKNNENLFTRKCYELSYDMFLQIEKYDDKVNYIQWSFATFWAFSTSGTFFPELYRKCPRSCDWSSGALSELFLSKSRLLDISEASEYLKKCHVVINGNASVYNIY